MLKAWTSYEREIGRQFSPNTDELDVRGWAEKLQNREIKYLISNTNCYRDKESRNFFIVTNYYDWVGRENMWSLWLFYWNTTTDLLYAFWNEPFVWNGLWPKELKDMIIKFLISNYLFILQMCTRILQGDTLKTIQSPFNHAPCIQATRHIAREQRRWKPTIITQTINLSSARVQPTSYLSKIKAYGFHVRKLLENT